MDINEIVNGLKCYVVYGTPGYSNATKFSVTVGKDITVEEAISQNKWGLLLPGGEGILDPASEEYFKVLKSFSNGEITENQLFEYYAMNNFK